MTTIAIRDGIVAYDTRITEAGYVHPNPYDKAKASVKHQCVFAGAGVLSNMAQAFRHLEAAPAMPWTEEGADLDWSEMLDEDTGLMIITREGRVFVFEAGGWFECTGPFYSAGSGFVGALAAMHAGADAVQAVEIACKVDSRSGPPIRFLDVREIPALPDFAMPAAQAPKQANFVEPKKKAPITSKSKPVKARRTGEAA